MSQSLPPGQALVVSQYQKKSAYVQHKPPAAAAAAASASNGSSSSAATAELAPAPARPHTPPAPDSVPTAESSSSSKKSGASSGAAAEPAPAVQSTADSSSGSAELFARRVVRWLSRDSGLFAPHTSLAYVAGSAPATSELIVTDAHLSLFLRVGGGSEATALTALKRMAAWHHQTVPSHPSSSGSERYFAPDSAPTPAEQSVRLAGSVQSVDEVCTCLKHWDTLTSNLKQHLLSYVTGEDCALFASRPSSAITFEAMDAFIDASLATPHTLTTTIQHLQRWQSQLSTSSSSPSTDTKHSLSRGHSSAEQPVQPFANLQQLVAHLKGTLCVRFGTQRDRQSSSAACACAYVSVDVIAEPWEVSIDEQQFIATHLVLTLIQPLLLLSYSSAASSASSSASRLPQLLLHKPWLHLRDLCSSPSSSSSSASTSPDTSGVLRALCAAVDTERVGGSSAGSCAAALYHLTRCALSGVQCHNWTQLIEAVRYLHSPSVLLNSFRLTLLCVCIARARLPSVTSAQFCGSPCPFLPGHLVLLVGAAMSLVTQTGCVARVAPDPTPCSISCYCAAATHHAPAPLLPRLQFCRHSSLPSRRWCRPCRSHISMRCSHSTHSAWRCLPGCVLHHRLSHSSAQLLRRQRVVAAVVK